MFVGQNIYLFLDYVSSYRFFDFFYSSLLYFSAICECSLNYKLHHKYKHNSIELVSVLSISKIKILIHLLCVCIYIN